MVTEGETRPAPILKWAGGKKQLLGEILPRLPEKMRTYYEPFVGGGAVFFALAAEGRFRRAVISDANPELTNLYTVVRDDLNALCEALEPHQAEAANDTWFYHVRSWNPEDLSPVERAARILFLNKTCFNGLYRVNRRGEFNVPFGKYKNPKVLDPKKLSAASQALQGVEIRCSDFWDIAMEAGRGDGIYFDPPYVPVSKTASFNTYFKDAFGDDTQARLVEAYRRCCSRGATAVMSNSDCPTTRELYSGLEVETVHASRAINSKASRRGPVTELLVVGAGQARRARPAPRLSLAS